MTRPLLLYPGCMVLGRFPWYESASRTILGAIDVEVRELEEFCCCGGSLVSGISENWIRLPAYTLAQAERDSLDVLTLCGGCTNIFRRAQIYLKNDSQLLERVNQTLGKLGLYYSGVVRIRHLIDILEENLTVLSRLATRQPEWRVALSPPCQVFRPSGLHGDRENGHTSMRRISEEIGIELVDYPQENDCCGSTLLTVDKSMAIRAGTLKLRSAIDHGADVVCVACGNCLFLLHRYQKNMGLERHIPIVPLPQLVGWAMGLTPEAPTTERSPR